jgi:hypothetical protein
MGTLNTNGFDGRRSVKLEAVVERLDKGLTELVA